MLRLEITTDLETADGGTVNYALLKWNPDFKRESMGILDIDLKFYRSESDLNEGKSPLTIVRENDEQQKVVFKGLSLDFSGDFSKSVVEPLVIAELETVYGQGTVSTV